MKPVSSIRVPLYRAGSRKVDLPHAWATLQVRPAKDRLRYDVTVNGRPR
jgi:hypothetical protein